MKASRFTDAQKAFVVKQGEDGVSVAEICRKTGISQATYFNWKKKYSGLMPSEMKRLRELEATDCPRKRIFEARDRGIFAARRPAIRGAETVRNAATYAPTHGCCRSIHDAKITRKIQALWLVVRE